MLPTGSNSVHLSIPIPAADRRPFSLPDPPMAPFTRRKFLLTAASTTAGALWLSACGSNQSTTSSAPAAGDTGSDTEVKGATLGFIALTDSAPLIIAQEKGLFAKHGMPDVKVVKQTSWAVTRDNLELGSAKGGIDGAHILSPPAAAARGAPLRPARAAAPRPATRK